jgi:Flp pilus assembly protein TadD
MRNETDFWRDSVLRSFLIGLFLVGAATFAGPNSDAAVATALSPEPVREPTFTQDIAPIILENCSPCHREGMSTPFNLLDYEDVWKRARLIVDVVSDRYMPPWLPEPGYGSFYGARHLQDAQIELIRKWVEQSGEEGPLEALPETPDWPTGWQAGTPDLIVASDGEFLLPSEGRDVYRNFVLSIPTKKHRYIRALEFRPSNARIVHHALIYVDRTRESRRRDQQSPEAGFDGMRVPDSAMMPEGQFLSWQPGATYSKETEGIPWLVTPGSDLVIQVHMNPSGKRESFRCEVGVYFSESKPKRVPTKIKLSSLNIDITPGDSQYDVHDEFVLPGDVDVTRVLPHAHYLCRRMEGLALLPSGERKSLILIEDWDFNWQGDYIYDPPIFLPKGTRIKMHFTYDNSSENAANPNTPSDRVMYGPQSSDEMAELWFQLLLRNPSDRDLFRQESNRKALAMLVEFGDLPFANETQDPSLLMMTAQAKMAKGDAKSAFELFRRVVQIDADRFNAWFNIGTILVTVGQLETAAQAFRKVISIDPVDAEAYGALGVVLFRLKLYEKARPYLTHALKLRPGDPIASRTLKQIEEIKGSVRASP